MVASLLWTFILLEAFSRQFLNTKKLSEMPRVEFRKVGVQKEKVTERNS